MARERADLGFGDDFSHELDHFNPEAWPTGPVADKETAASPEARELAVAAGFHSREGSPTQRPRRDRRRRTGRNLQLNIKVTQQTMDTFYAIADGQRWGLGETLERAVELLEARYGPSENH